MTDGWIKVHRSVQDSGFYTDSFAVHLWIHLVMEACHKPRKTIFNGRIVELKQGQLITGRKKLSQETGISEQVIRKWLELFEINQQITIEKTSAGSCISILNYKKYQEINQHLTSIPTNDQPTTNQPSTTIQELKELKELNKKRRIEFFEKSICDQIWKDHVMKDCRIINPEIWINQFKDHLEAIEENHVVIGKWRAHCVNWIKSELRKRPDQPKPSRTRRDATHG
jgi:hypothetical protein